MKVLAFSLNALRKLFYTPPATCTIFFCEFAKAVARHLWHGRKSEVAQVSRGAVEIEWLTRARAKRPGSGVLQDASRG